MAKRRAPDFTTRFNAGVLRDECARKGLKLAKSKNPEDIREAQRLLKLAEQYDLEAKASLPPTPRKRR
jgi:hypothetical protein